MQATSQALERADQPFESAAILHGSFVLSGVITTLLGPILPVLTGWWRLSDAQAGYFFTAQFLGSLVGVVLSSVLMVRWGYRGTLIIAFFALAAGVGSIGAGTWFDGLTSIFVFGAGLGLSIPATNLFVSDLYADRRAAALNILGLAWCAGAVATPGLTALALKYGGARRLFAALAAASAITAIGLASSRAIQRSASAASPPKPPQIASESPWRNRTIPVLALMFFLYVGTENAVSGWVGDYAKHFTQAGGTSWLIATACFWAALLVGRGFAPLFLRRVSERTLAAASLAVAAAGIATLLAADTPSSIFLGALLSGFGLAPVFPIAIAALSHVFGAMASRVAGLTFAFAAVGGASVPWLVGFVSTRSGSLRFALAVPLATALIMIGVVISRHGPLRSPGPTAPAGPL